VDGSNSSAYGAAAYLEAATQAVASIAAQHEAIAAVGARVADAIVTGHRVLAFGTGHSHLVAEEVFARAGGLRQVEAVLEPSMMLHEGPAKSSALERLSGYAAVLVEQAGVGPGDVVLVVSSSGRNAVPVEFAEESRRRGATVVAITSLSHSAAVTSRAPSGAKLRDVADLVLDNAAPVGDATVPLPGRTERVGPVSTVTGVVLVQAVMAEAAHLLAARGEDPGVLVSSNAGSDARTDRDARTGPAATPAASPPPIRYM
jgi:uncharacterized phosphosugar-binding protein